MEGTMGLHRWGRTLLRAFMAAAALAVIAPAPSAPAAKSTDLRIGITESIDTLNPFAGQLDSEYLIWAVDYPNLISFSQKDLSPDHENSLAKSWEQSSDGLTWTYHLRPGLKWSDGVPLTANDVVFTMNLSLKHPTYFSSYLEGVKSFVAESPTTVVAHLKHPSARMDNLWIPILPEHVWKAADPKHLDKFQPPIPMVGSGPWIVSAYSPKGTTIMTRNPNFFEGAKGPDRLLFILYRTKDSMAQDIGLDRLDVMYVADPSQYQTLASNKSLQRFRSPGFSFLYWVFNQSPNAAPGVHTKVVQDLAIRRALSYGLDRKKIVDTVLRGLGTRGNAILSPAYTRWYTDFSKDPQLGYAYDPAKARQILDAAGWKPGSDGIRVKDGVPARFSLALAADSQTNQQAGKLIRAMAQPFGIDVQLEIMSRDKMINLEYNTIGGKLAPSYDTEMWEIGGDPTPEFLLTLFTTAEINGWNDSVYRNPAYDRMFTQEVRSNDVAKRKGIITQMQRTVLRDLPYLFVYTADDLQVVNTKTWHGWTSMPQPVGQAISDYGFQPLLALKAGSAASNSYTGLVWIGIGLLALAVVVVGWILVRRRRGGGGGALELPDETGEGSAEHEAGLTR
jgi:peptide/nickel transport system substrate-binding protein